MKKNYLLLFAGTAMLLTGCGGTKYTREDSATLAGVTTKISYDLRAAKDTFTLKADTEITGVGDLVALTYGGDFTSTMTEKQSGNLENVENKENVYKLTTTKIVVSGFKAEGTGATAYTTTAEKSLKLASYISDEDAANIVDGKKVTIELEEADYIVTYVEVNPEEGTFTYSLGL